MIRIIDADKEHIPVIHKLAYRIWPMAFSDILVPEQVTYMLQWMYSIPSLEDQMNRGHQFLLAKEDGQYTGYASYELNYDSHTAKLHKLYVLSSARGKGVGKCLLEEVINRAKHKGQQALHLNVNRSNEAIQFYEDFGFRIIREEDNDIGNGFFMNDYVMELIL
jgi:GNAT superfamily N-acetyltransferase